MLFETVKIKDVKVKTGEWIRSLRKRQGLSQEELAEQLNLSRVTIQKLESGKNVTLETLLKALQYFDSLERFYQFINQETKNNNYDSLY